MRGIIFISTLLVVGNVFSAEKLVVTNQTDKWLRILYVHSKSPHAFGEKRLLPDHISVHPREIKEMPNTSINPNTIGLEVDNKILRDFDSISIVPEGRHIIIKELVPGELKLFQNDIIIASVQIK
jgi:hypothetical protein